MKKTISKIVLVILGWIAVNGCSSPKGGLKTLDEAGIRAITDDRRTWVDPAGLF